MGVQKGANRSIRCKFPHKKSPLGELWNPFSRLGSWHWVSIGLWAGWTAFWPTGTVAPLLWADPTLVALDVSEGAAGLGGAFRASLKDPRGGGRGSSKVGHFAVQPQNPILTGGNTQRSGDHCTLPNGCLCRRLTLGANSPGQRPPEFPKLRMTPKIISICNTSNFRHKNGGKHSIFNPFPRILTIFWYLPRQTHCHAK